MYCHFRFGGEIRNSKLAVRIHVEFKESLLNRGLRVVQASALPRRQQICAPRETQIDARCLKWNESKRGAPRKTVSLHLIGCKMGLDFKLVAPLGSILA
jgi:hypothetical protein